MLFAKVRSCRAVVCSVSIRYGCILWILYEQTHGKFKIYRRFQHSRNSQWWRRLHLGIYPALPEGILFDWRRWWFMYSVSPMVYNCQRWQWGFIQLLLPRKWRLDRWYMCRSLTVCCTSGTLQPACAVSSVLCACLALSDRVGL